MTCPVCYTEVTVATASGMHCESCGHLWTPDGCAVNGDGRGPLTAARASVLVRSDVDT